MKIREVVAMHIDPPSNILARWKLTRDDGTDMKPELVRFSAMTGLERAAPGRVSALLLLQLYAGATSEKLNPAKVVHEIAGLEAGLQRRPAHRAFHLSRDARA